METKDWQFTKPPHAVVVEVEYEGKIILGRAIWGSKATGVLPHWELHNGVHVEPSAISKWREI